MPRKNPMNTPKRKRLTKTAHWLARRRSHSTIFSNSNFGRTAAYYAPIHNLFLKYAGSPIGKRVLHLAASTGIYTRILQDEGAIAVVFDKSADATKIAWELGNNAVVRGNSKIKRANRYPHKDSLPFKDSSFDVFVSDHFLLSDYPAIDESYSRMVSSFQSIETLKELHRLLKPRGIGIVFRITLLPGNALAQIKEMGFEIVDNHFSGKKNRVHRFLSKYMSSQKYLVLKKKI